MREQQVDAIKAAASSAAKACDTFLTYLSRLKDESGNVFDISKKIPGSDSSISDIRARLASLDAFAQKLDAKSATLVPQSFTNAFISSCNAFTSQANQQQANLGVNIDNNGGLTSINYDNFQFLMRNGSVHDLSSHFKAIFDASESMLVSFQPCFQAINPSRAAFNYASAADALSRQLSSNNAAQQKLMGLAQKGEEAITRLNSLDAELTAIKSNAQQANNEVVDFRNSASAMVSEMETHRSQAESAGQVAKALKGTVDEYQAQFTEFDTRLTERREEITRGRASLKALLEQMQGQEGTIADLIEKSKQMLSSATVAGLASEFGTIRTNLSTELNDAHKSFKWAIGILIASSIPLILFIFSPIIAPLVSSNDKFIAAAAGLSAQASGLHYLGQVMARLVILVPAAWYVAFCSSRYNSLFRLREHYSYKYSMAVSVEGFKKQAPGYEEMIAALVLEQLAFNPADKLAHRRDDTESKPPHPILRLLIDKLERNFARDGADAG